MPSEGLTLLESIRARGPSSGELHGARGSIALADLAHASAFGAALESLRDRTVLIATRDQLTAALALLELDGVARRIILCTPDLNSQYLPGIIGSAGAQACVIDADSPLAAALDLPVRVLIAPRLEPLAGERRSSATRTQWVLLTSGTTGAPKLVLHTLASLTFALTGQPPAPQRVTWSTFYDIRRYGGLQIFLRAVHLGSLVLSDPSEAVADFFGRVAAGAVTHISGTPSHWRKALMSGLTARIAPEYVRLSGEIPDQGVLDGLKAAYPQALVAHAFASTEAGVAFEVRDGLAGFPAGLVGAPGARVELKVEEDTLRIRSGGTAQRYLGEGVEPLRGPDGFVDTGDRVEARNGRYYFLGRRGGVINVGGLKVHPEEVEAVLNSHPWVRLSLVRPRRNPITGAVVSAEVVIKDAEGGATPPSAPELVRELTERCRQALPAHKFPAMIRIVPSLEISPSGKLVRPNA